MISSAHTSRRGAGLHCDVTTRRRSQATVDHGEGVAMEADILVAGCLRAREIGFKNQRKNKQEISDDARDITTG